MGVAEGGPRIELGLRRLPVRFFPATQVGHVITAVATALLALPVEDAQGAQDRIVLPVAVVNILLICAYDDTPIGIAVAAFLCLGLGVNEGMAAVDEPGLAFRDFEGIVTNGVSRGVHLVRVEVEGIHARNVGVGAAIEVVAR